MEHEMKLQPEYYNFILNGTKRIEIRLFDEKRQQIKIGDTIKFLKEPDLNESFNAKVTGLLRYNSFEDLFEDIDFNICGPANSLEEKLDNIHKIYSIEDEKKYGILAIRIEKV